MADQKGSDEERPPVDLFTHSSTRFPGAWTEEEIEVLLDAWEEAVKAPRTPGKVFYVAEKILEILKKKNFRPVERDEVWKQISTLRTEYTTYLGLLKIGIPTVKGNCVPQLERIWKKSTARKRRRRRTSTASNQIGSISEDDANQNGTFSQPESAEDENTSRARRVRFQRQNLQRSVRTMIAQQRTVMESISTFMKTFSDSNDKIIYLLGELVALQKISSKTDVETS